MISPSTGKAVRVPLSVMMFLQYAIWGAWLPLLWPFLREHRNFEPSQIGNMFAVSALGALLAPFIAGQIADRYYSTERFLGISHIIGGLLVWQLASLDSYWQFLMFSFFYSVIYSPTLPLTNALAFHHLTDRDADFGRVRVWGTVGWIAAGLTIGQWLLFNHTPAGTPEAVRAAQVAGMADAFRLSGVLGVVMGCFCFFLPHTPPSKEAKTNATWQAARSIFSNRRLSALFALSIAVSCVHQFYFVHAAGFVGTYQSPAADAINKIFGVGGGGLMTIGQMSEIVVLGIIPLVAKTTSRKTLLSIGLIAYTLRMFLFAYVDSITAAVGIPHVAVLMSGIALHGVCFGCFIFVAFMIVDEETTPDVRASAQSLFNMVVVGFGIIVGSKVATGIADWAKTADGKGIDFKTLFSAPMYGALLCLITLLLVYPGGKREPAMLVGDGQPQPEKAKA